MSDIGKQLKQARDARGHSQQTAAQAIGCSIDAIRKWESDRRTPTGLYRDAVKAYVEKAGAAHESE